MKINMFYKKRYALVSLILLNLWANVLLIAQTTGSATQEKPVIVPWNFMSLSTTGVDSFLLQHPTYDGRGVICLIFDTGIDFSQNGLATTTTGDKKIIDAFDFANSCLLKFKKADKIKNKKGETIFTAEGLHSALKDIPSNAEQNEIYLAEINEYNWRNAAVRDFDGDGEAKSYFATMLYKTNNEWKVVVDTDADSLIKNENSIGNFTDQQEHFIFKQKNKSKAPMGFAAKIDGVTKQVNFICDVSGHGTHVAGIVAGYNINNEKGFNGVSPGTKLVCGKISCDSIDDITITGSMKRAYEWAGKFSDSMAKFRTPVVVNMSFGIGSALEGRAEIENFLDDFLPKHKNLFVVTSAGNEGPGLSTTGIPACASSVITVGALLPKGIARDGYAMALNQDILWDFSSRGGEVDKPDIVAPGTAVSTIPNHSYESRESGTSMASPNAAGIVCNLLSALRQEFPNFQPTQSLIKRALRASANKMKDYELIEQGGGIININHAYKTLKKWIETGFAENIQEYKVSTESNNYPDSRGSTAFWRSTYFPKGQDRQEFTVFRATSLQGDTTDFFRAYSLESNADWLSAVQKNIFIKNNQSAKIDCLYDETKMKTPGIYCGKIVAKRLEAKGAASEGEFEFELLNTVIVPYQFSADMNYSFTTPNYKLNPGVSKRFYIAMPNGALAVRFKLNVEKNSTSNVMGKVIDSRGLNVAYIPQATGSKPNSSSLISKEDLGDGIIEIVINADAYQGQGEPSEFSLTAEAVMMSVKTEVKKGKLKDELIVHILNNNNAVTNIDASYVQKGYMKTTYETINRDTFSMPLAMRKDDGALWATIKFNDNDYMKSTDIITQIVDANGEVQAQEAYNKNAEWLFVPNFMRDSAKFKLQLFFGASSYEIINHYKLEIIEKHVRPDEPKKIGGYGLYKAVPFIERTLYTEFKSLPTLQGFKPIYELKLKLDGEEQSINIEFSE